jgi:hypothetical protein
MLGMGDNSARSFARVAPRDSRAPLLGATLMRRFGTHDDRPDLWSDTSVPLGMRLGDLCLGGHMLIRECSGPVSRSWVADDATGA